MRTWARAVVIVGLTVLAPLGCGRFQRARSYEVERTGDPAAAYQVVQQVLKEKSYKVAEEQAPERRVRVSAHIGEGVAAQQSWITVQVTPEGRVSLTPSGALVKGKTLHKRLASEVSALEWQISQRVGAGPTAPAAPSAVASTSTSTSTGTPVAWNERAYDPKTWGPGEFTCVPVKLTSDAQKLKLRLSNGLDADIAISVAYDASLCRSPAACSLPEGCPALGLGDTQQVARLAERLSQGAISAHATLLQEGQPVANIDLSQHGSVAQALTQLNSTGGTRPAGAAPAP